MDRKEMEVILKYSYRGKEILEYINKLERALDKACQQLEVFDIRNLDHVKITKEEWKKELLK